MKFQPERAEGAHQITRHDRQGLWVDGQPQPPGSIVVPWQGAPQAWRPERFESLSEDCFSDLLAWEPELVIFGSGASLRFAPPRLYRRLIERRIGMETMDTAAACRTFNVLSAEGRKVLAALLASR